MKVNFDVIISMGSVNILDRMGFIRESGNMGWNVVLENNKVGMAQNSKGDMRMALNQV